MAVLKTLTVSSPPHLYGTDTVRKRMRDVLIALAPACIIGIYRFGFRAFLIIMVSVLSALLAEYLFRKAAGKPTTINDLSAAITGLLLALNLPADAPVWLPVIGCVFAIVAVKQLFGGLGSNFMNPALAARAFLIISFPVHMTRWVFPASAPAPVDGITSATYISESIDAVTGATYLNVLKGAPSFVPRAADYLAQLTGNTGGCIGEVSAVAVLLGGAYLIARRVINWRIPVFYIGSFALSAFIFGRNGFFSGHILFEVLSGGLLLGAFFMATDYATSPITPNGKIIMGIGCGFLTVVIRFFSGYPEGVMFAILIMNVLVPTIDKYVKPRVYGKNAGPIARFRGKRRADTEGLKA